MGLFETRRELISAAVIGTFWKEFGSRRLVLRVGGQPTEREGGWHATLHSNPNQSPNQDPSLCLPSTKTLTRTLTLTLTLTRHATLHSLCSKTQLLLPEADPRDVSLVMVGLVRGSE